MKTLWMVSVTLLIALGTLQAQQQRGGRFENLAAQEKQMVLDSIQNLNDDQKQLIEFVYAQYGESIKTMREEMMAGGDREGMREKMQAIRKEKNEGLKDIFNEEQMASYRILMENARSQMQERRRERRGKRNGEG